MGKEETKIEIKNLDEAKIYIDKLEQDVTELTTKHTKVLEELNQVKDESNRNFRALLSSVQRVESKNIEDDTKPDFDKIKI
jgi:uncharacterized protein YoxC